MSALRAFDMMEEKYVISWTAVISACSRKGMVIKLWLCLSKCWIMGSYGKNLT